ncbi:Zn-dependent protease [Bacillus sp. FJAT-49705]|uniref:Zn-dependent protease n=1 Tax=Cytobacillus citreus TaxID=2833586 RepID=A0ABS5NZB4_9BACI|nr:DUF2268 domain-containing putative Zn-dependent protease [Cytobacillus citreus]MBS4193160.1 Zn-dependent protease [Cytobacillus citreus]
MKKNTFLFVAIILFLFGCSHKETQNQEEEETPVFHNVKMDVEDLTHSFENPETKQKFKIVDAYKLYNSYIEKAEQNPKELTRIYKEEILDPVYNSCFRDAEHIHLFNEFLYQPPSNFTELKNVVGMMNTNFSIEVVEEALTQSSNLLTSEIETNVCIFPTTVLTGSPMINAGAGKIIVFYNKNYTDDVLQAGLAHEYHHSVWTERHIKEQPSFTVLDNLVFEGKAVMFEKTVFPNVNFTRVDPRYIKTYWDKIEPDLGKYDINRSLEILVGGKELPQLYGYSEGYKMVKSYLELNPNMTPDEWTGINTKEIFEKGNYIDNFQ